MRPNRTFPHHNYQKFPPKKSNSNFVPSLAKTFTPCRDIHKPNQPPCIALAEREKVPSNQAAGDISFTTTRAPREEAKRIPRLGGVANDGIWS